VNKARSVSLRTLVSAVILLVVVAASALTWQSVNHARASHATSAGSSGQPPKPATIGKVASHRLLIVGAS
jgi:hypothetical protein